MIIQPHTTPSREFDLAPARQSSNTEPSLGGFIYTENEPDSPWPPGNYCAWRVTAIKAGIVSTVLDLEESQNFSRPIAAALADRP